MLLASRWSAIHEVIARATVRVQQPAAKGCGWVPPIGRAVSSLWTKRSETTPTTRSETTPTTRQAIAAGLRRLTELLEPARPQPHVAEVIATGGCDELYEHVLADLQHDLGNPLAAILLSSSHLLATLPPGDPWEPRRAQLENIDRAVRRLRHLIGQLSDALSLRAHHVRLRAEPLAASTLVEDATRLLAQLAEQRGIALRARAADDQMVLADSERILRVLSNLIGNAIKFTPEGGVILVQATSAGDSIRFSVADSGPGIDPLHVRHVFDRYWCAPGTAAAGDGIGLAIARGLVEAHGGRIWVETQPGRGSTFFFDLPRAAPVDAVPELPTPPPTSRGQSASA